MRKALSILVHPAKARAEVEKWFFRVKRAPWVAVAASWQAVVSAQLLPPHSGAQ